MKLLLLSGAVHGFLAVLLGAFGAHGLRSRLGALPDAARRFEWWETAARYHLAHALALVLAALLAERIGGRLPAVAGGAFFVGVLLFSGSLYVMTLTGARALGAVTPLGGLAFLVGWAALALAAWRL